jgi:hypothetical protein
VRIVVCWLAAVLLWREERGMKAGGGRDGYWMWRKYGEAVDVRNTL